MMNSKSRTKFSLFDFLWISAIYIASQIKVTNAYNVSDIDLQDRSSMGSVKSPFFFLCNSPQQGEPSTAGLLQNVTIFLKTGVKNMDDGYEPLEVYEILVDLSIPLDGFLLTGAHFLTKEYTKSNYLNLPISTKNINSAGLVCTVLHEHISRKPQTSFSFLWLAPQTGTGCVRFLATGSMQDELLFKDLLVKEVCEKEIGDVQKMGKLIQGSSFDMGNDRNAFILYEDFDSLILDTTIWLTSEEGHLITTEFLPTIRGHYYGPPNKTVILESVPLDFSKAQHLQYTVGRESCKTSRGIKVYLGYILPNDGLLKDFKRIPNGEQGTRYDIVSNADDTTTGDIQFSATISVGNTSIHCNHWKNIDYQRIDDANKVHIIGIPNSYRRNAICLKFESMGSFGGSDDDCWTLDNVAVISTESHQGNVWDDFDNINPSNWLFFPGGKIKEACNSQGNAIVFDRPGLNWLKSRQLDFSYNISRNPDIIFYQDFSDNFSIGWSVYGNKNCPTGKNGDLRFGGTGVRKVCSRLIDTSLAGVLILRGGEHNCNMDGDVTISVNLFEDSGNELYSKKIILEPFASNKAINLPSNIKNRSLSICLQQDGDFEEDTKSWTIKSLVLLPWLPSKPEYFFQALTNLKCNDEPAEILIESSIDGGKIWNSVVSKCTHKGCFSYPDKITSLSALGLDVGWGLVTLPLSYSALGSHTIMKISQIEDANAKNNIWAIDNIFIGRCSDGCNGHGLCQKDGTCKCEYGFSGQSCGVHQQEKPVYIYEPFLADMENSANILAVIGGKNSFTCGIIGTGTAAVFDGETERTITTIDLDTTHAHVIQFYFQAGTYSQVGKCPGPDQDDENIYVHYSCLGGSVWKLLHTLHARKHKSTSLISLNLPSEARNKSCRFQIWQAHHSGLGTDMWAIDDLTVTSKQLDNIEISFNDYTGANDSLRFLLGKIGTFCGREESLLFSDHNNNGLTRFLETKSLSIGPSFMMQFDLIIGCGSNNADEAMDSTVALEYSFTHGLTWQIMQRPCTPSTPNCGSFFSTGTVYHSSEFNDWKRVTLFLPKHVWSQAVRFRLRQYETSEYGISWAVDNIYIGKLCNGCSGHGYCTSGGCRCDEQFHGYKCLPESKLKSQLYYTFDEIESTNEPQYRTVGGERANGLEGCGTVVSGNNLYFGKIGLREFQSDDTIFEGSKIVMFTLVIGASHALSKNCLSTKGTPQMEGLNEGSVVLEFSNDGGITWNFLKELIAESYRKPKPFNMNLDEEISEGILELASIIRFRLWQPKHSLNNQWAIDDFQILSHMENNTLMADVMKGSLLASPWLSSSKYSQKKYCNSEDFVNVLDSTDPVRTIVTQKLKLNEDDVIMFEINIGCKREWSNGHAVMLEFSRDGGEKWSLVQEKCLPSSPDCLYVMESSLYWPGHHGQWTNILIRVDHRFAGSDINLRWTQLNPSQTSFNEFALRKIYIGPACESDCHGHGMCNTAGQCKCDKGFNGTYCEEHEHKSLWMKDTFDNLEFSKSLWTNLEGATLSAGCGSHRDGHVLMLSGGGPRFIETKEINTYNINYISFELGIGGSDAESHCEIGVSPRDNVLFAYSINNGLEWNLIREFEASETIARNTPYIIYLPFGARSLQTKFRWWQSLPYMSDTGGKQAEWEIDNVLIMANETYRLNLDQSVDPNNLWFLVSGNDDHFAAHDLYFSDSNTEKYAETWDILSQEGSFVQFDINIKSKNNNRISFIRLEFSLDYGKSWSLLNDEMKSSLTDTEADTSSIYSSKIYKNQRRITATLPSETIGYPLRLRFYQQKENNFSSGLPGSLEWSIQNLFMGNACPWLCNGHGYCLFGKCKCDESFFGEHCVPNTVLPCELIDNFDSGSYWPDLWSDIQGAEVTDRHGVLVHKAALIFIKESPRYGTTIDLDMTAGRFLQFTISYVNSKSPTNHPLSLINNGYREEQSNRWENIFTRNEEEIIYEIHNDNVVYISVQFSTNGGINWKTIEKIMVEKSNKPIFYSITFDDFPKIKTNSSRFRLWQEGSHGISKRSWAIDSFYIGGLKSNPDILHDNFNSDMPHSDAWIEWPSGSIGPMCDGTDANRNSTLTFLSSEGQHALYSKDIYISPFSVIQFDIRVGCGNSTFARDSVSLEYSTNYGITWSIVREACLLDQSTPHCLNDLQAPSTYFANSSPGWKRITIPLSFLPTCGNARFRWWQRYYHLGEVSIDWSVDNVYIGPSCNDHCRGHGYCLNADRCICDPTYEGKDNCFSVVQNPKHFLENFEADSVDINLFTSWSGAQVSSQCEVIRDNGLFFWMEGERMLVTEELDLEHGKSIEFYLRFDCMEMWEAFSTPSPKILLMFSTNGGVQWINIKTLIFKGGIAVRPQTNFFSIDIPIEARTNSTKLRWWQPSANGTFPNKWAIDHIYVSNSDLTPTFFYDDGRGNSWHVHLGSTYGSSCELNGLYFTGSEPRFAETKDMRVQHNSFLQVEVVMGCGTTNCFDIRIEYSINFGKSWKLLEKDPRHFHRSYSIDSILRSDVYIKPTIVTIFLPEILTSWQKTARFRFLQKAPFKSEHSWVISRTYVGNECPRACFGRGFCDCGICICNEGWIGESCELRKNILADYIADDFELHNYSAVNWNKIDGGKISDVCGPVASKFAMHFYGGCTRLLESNDIDLRDDFFVQFNFISGCYEVKNRDWQEYQLPIEKEGIKTAIYIQISCNSGIFWKTLKTLNLVYTSPKYIWIKIPTKYRCLGGRIRWIQYPTNCDVNTHDWAIDGVFIGGKVIPGDELIATHPADFKFPDWHKTFNWIRGKYCNINETVAMFESTPTEASVLQTRDIYIGSQHSLQFNISLGCGALWNNNIEPVRLEYTIDYGRSWNLVRSLCLPYNSSSGCEMNDESIFYAPQDWQYYVFPLSDIGPSKYTRFRWIQESSAEVTGSHVWAIKDIYIGHSCLYHCNGRGKCISRTCYCDPNYKGTYCETYISGNLPYIKDEFKYDYFEPHWNHAQGGLLSGGCGNEMEEPPSAVFQGYNGRVLSSIPLDTRSSRFVLFTAHIGSSHGVGLCRTPTSRHHNVFLQYSINGGIYWHLLRELDFNLYGKPREDYIILPRKAMTAATSFRFWQPRMYTHAPAWSLDNIFIGGSEIGTSQFIDSFNGEPTVAEWLFAPHSHLEKNYCERGDNGSIVWKANHPGHRSITTQELIIYDGHVLQFKISVGCQRHTSECYFGPLVYLEFNKDGGANGWEPLKDFCYPETSNDPNCIPYVFHGSSTYGPDMYSSWSRVIIPLPEKTWSSSAQIRWVQDAGKDHGLTELILPWALDDIYVGIACDQHCRGHGDCVAQKCVCDSGYEGTSCEPSKIQKDKFPSSLVDGFEIGTRTSWSIITGGSIGLGCNSLAPYGNGKHLYFNGCGIRQAITIHLDARRVTKISFVLRIGSHDHTPSCKVDLSNTKDAGNKGVLLQYSINNGITWETISFHDPLDFKKARRVAYSLPDEAKYFGMQLRWWQPMHNGIGTDQWALDNVEVIMNQRKMTNEYETRLYRRLASYN